MRKLNGKSLFHSQSVCHSFFATCQHMVIFYESLCWQVGGCWRRGRLACLPGESPSFLFRLPQSEELGEFLTPSTSSPFFLFPHSNNNRNYYCHCLECQREGNIIGDSTASSCCCCFIHSHIWHCIIQESGHSPLGIHTVSEAAVRGLALIPFRVIVDPDPFTMQGLGFCIGSKRTRKVPQSTPFTLLSFIKDEMCKKISDR